MRSVLRIILALLVLGMALLLVLAFLSARPELLRARVRDALAQELAQLSDRQVQIGEVSGNLLTGIRIDNLALADDRGFPDGVILAARQATVSYDLVAVLSGRAKAAASIKEIDLNQAYARVERSPTGEINLVKLFERVSPLRPPSAEGFQPLVTFHDSVVDVVAAGAGRYTFRTRLASVNGTLKLSLVGPLRLGLNARSSDGAFGALSLRVWSDSQQHYLLAEGRVEDLPLARWASLLPVSSAVRVAGGSASADFQLWSVPSAGSTTGPVLLGIGSNPLTTPPHLEFGYSAQVALRGVSLGLPPSAGGEARLSSAQLQLTPQGVEIVDLDGSWQGLPLRAAGWIYDFSQPRADLHLQAHGVDLAALRRQLPPAFAKLLPADLAGSGDLTADAIGPLAHLNADLSLSLPQGAMLSTAQTGEIALGSTTVRAVLWDSASPAVLVDLVSSDASLEAPVTLATTLTPSAPAEQSPLSLRKVGSVRAQVLQVGPTPLVRATVAGVEGTYEGRGFANLSADLTMTGRTVRLPRLQADALGGRLQAEALVTLPAQQGEKLRIIANGRAEDVKVALLPASLLGEAAGHLRGTVSSDFGVTWQGSRGRAVGSVELRDAAYDDYQIDRLQALASVDFGPRGDWKIAMPLADVQGPSGHFSVSGTAVRDGPVDVTADLGALDLASLPLKGDKPAGSAYGRVRLTGSLAEPEVSGQVVVFRPRYQDYQASALVADFSARPWSLAAADLYPPAQCQVLAYVSYESAVARADLTLTPPVARDQPPGLAGELRLAGLRTESLPRLLGERWPQELATVTGLAQVTATLSGTTAAPVAQGQVDLSQLDYEHFFVNAVRAPFTFALAPPGQDQLVVKGGTLTTEGATLTFDGSAQDLFGEWSFVARAQARDIHLERLAAVLPVRLPLAGEAFIPQITVKGSAAGLTGDGRLLAPDVTVGDSQVKGVDTHFLIDKGQVRLERTTFEAAGGKVQAELTYTLADRSVDGAVEAADVDLSSALALAAPLVAAPEKTEEAYLATQRHWQQWSLRSHGVLSATVKFHGPLEKLAGTATVGLTEGAYESKPMPDVHGSFAFDAGQRELTDIDAEMRSGQALMTVTGRVELDGALSLVADATNVDLASWSDWFPRELGLGGVAGITIQAQGTTQSPEITASVDVLSASLRGVGFDLVSIPVVKVAESGIDLDRIIFKRGERQVVGSGHLPFSWHPVAVPLDEPVSFMASVENTDLGFFPPIINEFTRYARRAGASDVPSPWLQLTASGTVDSRVKVSGTLGQPTLEGYLRLAKGAINHPGWKNPITDLAADLTVRSADVGNLVEVGELSGRWDQTRLALTGSAHVTTLDSEQLARNGYDLALTVNAENQPLWTGQTLNALHGTATLTTDPGGAQMLRFANVAGTVGQGNLSLDGSVHLTNFRPAAFAGNDFDLAVKAVGVPLTYPDTLRAVLDGSLRVSNPSAGQPAVISGVLSLDHGTVGFPQSAARSDSKGMITGLGPAFPDFGLDVRVATGSDLTLRTPALVAPFVPTAAAALAQGSLLAPRLHGSLQTKPREGNLPGSDFSLRAMDISYSLSPVEPRTQPPYALQLTGGYHGIAEQTLPYVQVEGRSIGQVHLTMTIDSDFAQPDKGTVVRVTAEPPLSQEQIAVLIGLAGLVPGGTTDVDELLSQRFVSILGRGFREAIFTPIEAQVRRALGLTEFTVLFSFGQPLEVRLGKYLASNFLITYRYSLISPRNEQWNLGISYDLPGKLSVTYSTNESAETQFRVGRSWTF